MSNCAMSAEKWAVELATAKTLLAEALRRLEQVQACEPAQKTPVIQPAQDGSEWVSPAEFARRVGISIATVRRWVKRDQFPCAKVDRAIRINYCKAQAWLEAQR